MTLLNYGEIEPGPHAAGTAQLFDHAEVRGEPVTADRLRRAAEYVAAMADAYAAGPMERAWADYRAVRDR